MYTFAQFENAWINAGGPVAVAPIAAAIAAAESTWGTKNQGDAYAGIGYTSFGPWQIHILDPNGNAVNVQPNGQPYDAARLANDLGYNAQAAVDIYKSQGFNAWTTFKNHSFLAYLPASSSAPSPSPAASSTTGGPNAQATFSPVALSPQVTTLVVIVVFVLVILAVVAMGRKQKAQAT